MAERTLWFAFGCREKDHWHTVVGTAVLRVEAQPGSRFQFDTSTPSDLPGFVELLCNVAELALALRAEPAERDFLQAICDGAQQQLAAEMRGCLGFVESAPLLPQFAEREFGEARERLPATRNIRRARLMPAPPRQCDRRGRAPLAPKRR